MHQRQGARRSARSGRRARTGRASASGNGNGNGPRTDSVRARPAVTARARRHRSAGGGGQAAIAAARPALDVSVPRQFMTHVSLAGKVGLVVGVANKRSISWAIAQAAAARRRVARPDVSGRAARRERARAGGDAAATPLILPCDVTQRRRRSTRCSRRSTRSYGGLDFLVHGVAFADREDLARPFSETSREGFRTGAGHQRVLAGRAGRGAPRR